MPTAQIVTDPRKFEDARQLLSPRAYRAVMQAALSRTTKTGETRVNRKIREVLNLKRKDVDPYIKATLPSFDRLEGTIAVSRNPVPLADYGATQSRKGVRVRIWKGSGSQVLAGTFIQNTPRSAAGSIGVLERDRVGGGLGRGGKIGKYPTSLRFGPAAITALVGNKAHEGAQEEVSVELDEVLDKNVDSQLDRFMRNPGSFKNLLG